MLPVFRYAFLPLGIMVAQPSSAATLQDVDVIKQTLATHPEVSASVNSRLSADHDLCSAKGGYLPSINFNAVNPVSPYNKRCLTDLLRRAKLVGREQPSIYEPTRYSIRLRTWP